MLEIGIHALPIASPDVLQYILASVSAQPVALSPPSAVVKNVRGCPHVEPPEMRALVLQSTDDYLVKTTASS
jgi:hypothetical protein